MNCDYILPGNPLEHSRAKSLTIYPVRCCYSICVACCASDFRKYLCLFILIYNLREFLRIEYQSRGSAHCHIIDTHTQNKKKQRCSCAVGKVYNRELIILLYTLKACAIISRLVLHRQLIILPGALQGISLHWIPESRKCTLPHNRVEKYNGVCHLYYITSWCANFIWCQYGGLNTHPQAFSGKWQ